MTVQLTDKASVTSRVLDSRGNLKVRATFSRVGIQRYTARELGLQGRPPGDILRIFRPEEEVFSQESLDSFDNAPVTDDHPSENVTSSNFRQYAVGFQVGKRTREGDHTVGDILISDAATIAKVDNGKAEISDGYACEIRLQSGEWKGQVYDGVKTNIRGNHIAIVGAGRCGGSCRIQDGAICSECAGDESEPCNCHGDDEMSNGGQPSPQLVTRLVDGLTIQTTDQGGQAIDKLTTQLADASRKMETAQAALEAANTAHASALEAKDGEIAGLQARLSDEAIEALVTERAELVRTVSDLMGPDYDTKGKSNIQMMTDVASKAYGLESVKDRKPEYIEALFTTVKKPSGEHQDTIRSTVSDSLRQSTQNRSTTQVRDDSGQPRGREAYLHRLTAGRSFGQAQNGGQ